MRATFNESINRPILINGKQISLIKSPRPSASFDPFTFYNPIHETPRSNMNFSFQTQSNRPHLFSLNKTSRAPLSNVSPIKPKSITFHYSPSNIEIKRIPLTRQCTRPQSVKQSVLKNTALFDNSIHQHMNLTQNIVNPANKFRNISCLRPSSKPTIVKNTKFQQTVQNQLEIYLPTKSYIKQSKILDSYSKDPRQTSIETSLMVRQNETEQKKYIVKLIYEEESPTMSKQGLLDQNQQRVKTLNSIQVQSEQKTAQINLASNQKLQENQLSHQQLHQKIQTINFQIQQKQRNKTSFDNEIPQQQSQSSAVKQPEHLFKKICVRKINSLFNPTYQHQQQEFESSSFDFSTSNHRQGNQLYISERKPKRKRKLTVYSRHFSQSSDENFQNQDFCTYLESELNKENNKTNSSFSFQELDPLYQPEREIMIRYLQSLHKESRRSRGSKSSDITNKKLLYAYEDQINEGNGKLGFLQFINDLYKLQVQKYSNQDIQKHTIRKQSYKHAHQHHHHPQTPYPRNSHQIHINTDLYFGNYPQTHHHHNSFSHHTTHYDNAFVYPNHHSLAFDDPTLSQPHIHHLVDIGEDFEEIKENKMIIHVISIWLKDMGYLREETKVNVVDSVKRLLLDDLWKVEDYVLSPEGNLDGEKDDAMELKLESTLHQTGPFESVSNEKKHISDPIHEFNPFSTYPANQTSPFQFSSSPSFFNNQNHLKSKNYHIPPQKQPKSQLNQQQLQQTISSIYSNLYHKILPTELQLLILVNLCKRGWKFFEFITVKIIKTIYTHHQKQKSSKKKDKEIQLCQKLDKLVRKFVNQ